MTKKEWLIPVYEPDLGQAERRYLMNCIEQGWISGIGEYVERFENSFSAFCGARHGVATCNGTVAIDLALATLNIGPGDEVIIPDLTFVATANAVCHVGASPVMVDSEAETWNIDPKKLEAAVTPRTKAIIAVHLYGHPADLQPILDIAQRHGLFVIEDAAEAHGALYRGERVGGLADIGCFSFYGNKVVTAGEGGMLITNNDRFAARARYLRGQAMDPKHQYWHTEVGFNFRMTNLQAAIGLGQTERIETILARKREIAERYSDRLRAIPGIIPPPEADWARNVFWMYSVLVDPSSGVTRDTLGESLNGLGVETRPFFYPVSALPPFKQFRTAGPCPVARDLSARGINLPSSPKLSDAAVDRVVEAISVSLEEAQNCSRGPVNAYRR